MWVAVSRMAMRREQPQRFAGITSARSSGVTDQNIRPDPCMVFTIAPTKPHCFALPRLPRRTITSNNNEPAEALPGEIAQARHCSVSLIHGVATLESCFLHNCSTSVFAPALDPTATLAHSRWISSVPGKTCLPWSGSVGSNHQRPSPGATSPPIAAEYPQTLGKLAFWKIRDRNRACCPPHQLRQL
jgi:hypothetical protein